MSKTARSRFFLHVLCGLMLQSTVFCSDERPLTPPANDTTAAGNALLAMLVVQVKIEPEQPDVREGLHAEVLIINRNTLPIDLIHPQNSSSMEIYTADGKYVHASQPARVFQRTGAERQAVLHLDPGQEHRFTVVVKDHVPPGPLVAAETTTTEGAETGIASTDTLVGSGPAAAAAVPRFVPLPVGTYTVRLRVPLTLVPTEKGQRANVRVVSSEAVKVVYGAGSSAGSDQG